MHPLAVDIRIHGITCAHRILSRFRGFYFNTLATQFQGTETEFMIQKGFITKIMQSLALAKMKVAASQK